MKVLHLISGGDEGGAKTHVLTLLSALIKNNVDVQLLCIMESSFTKEATNLNIPLKVITQKKRYDFKTIFKIKNFIKSGNYDLIHCHGARANFIAFFIKKYIDAPFITTLHSDYKLDFKDNFFKQIIFMPLNFLAIKSFDYILPVTTSFNQMLIDRGFTNKMFVIYNGINLQQKINTLSKKEFFEKYNIPLKEGYTYVGIAARLNVVKGFDDFLNACKILLSQNQKIIFLIAGSGTLEKHIKSFISVNNFQNNIKLLGFVEDINSFYNSIDINILTSHSESFPYSLLEGARAKKATIATNVGGIPEMIIDFETGLLVNPKNSMEIAKKIKLFINSPSLMQSCGSNFYDYVYNNFSDITMANSHINIYKTILKEMKK